MPERCPAAPEADLLNRPLRQLIYGSGAGAYRVIFRLEVGSEPVVRVLAIRHGARLPLTPEELNEV